MDALNSLLQLFTALLGLLTLVVVFLCFVVSIFGFLVGLLVSAALEPKRKGVTIALSVAAVLAILLCFVSVSAATFLFSGAVVGSLVGTRLHASDF